MKLNASEGHVRSRFGNASFGALELNNSLDHVNSKLQALECNGAQCV